MTYVFYHAHYDFPKNGILFCQEYSYFDTSDKDRKKKAKI